MAAPASGMEEPGQREEGTSGPLAPGDGELSALEEGLSSNSASTTSPQCDLGQVL